MTQPPDERAAPDLELDVMSTTWDLLTRLDEHARARVLLWLTRRHQNVGDYIDLPALERQSRGA